MDENNEINSIEQSENSARAAKIKAIREAVKRAREAEEREQAARHQAAPELSETQAQELPEVQPAVIPETVEDVLAALEGTAASPAKEMPVEEAHEVQAPVEEVPEAPEVQAAAEEVPEAETPVQETITQPTPEEAPPAPEKKPKKKKKKKKRRTFLQRLRGLFPEKGDSILEIIRKFAFLTAVAVVIVCGYLVGDYELDLLRNRLRNKEIADLSKIYEPIRNNYYDDEDKDELELKYYSLLMRAQKLLDLNPEIVGYLEIPTIDGDPIVSLPVVQASNNEKYLDLSFDLKESRAGALFMDWRCSFDQVANHHLANYNSENYIVYGHNMADDSMFGTFKYYHKIDDYYSKHPIVYFDSNYETYTFKIFSVMILDADDETDTKFDCWNRANFRDEDDFYWFVNECKRRTIRTNDVDVKYGDQLLTLFTCNTYLGERGRLVLVARRLRSGEDLYEGTQNSVRNPNIKWPTMYYNTVTNEKYDPDNFVPFGPDVKTEDKKDDKKDENKDENKNEKKDDGDKKSETEE